MGAQPSWNVDRSTTARGGTTSPQVYQNLELLAEPFARRAVKPFDIKEEKLLGEGEVLRQQPVACKRARRVREHPFVGPKADRSSGS